MTKQGFKAKDKDKFIINVDRAKIKKKRKNNNGKQV